VCVGGESASANGWLLEDDDNEEKKKTHLLDIISRPDINYDMLHICQLSRDVERAGEGYKDGFAWR
jgi:hypothetical protein